MDGAHSSQLLRARMLDGSNRIFWVRIYPARKTAKVFHETHAFGFPWWEPFPDEWEGVGFHEPDEVWQPNRYTAPPGQHHRGEYQWFKTGLPIDQLATRPVPDVCAGPAIDDLGGMTFDGAGWPDLRASDVVDQAVVITATSGPQTIHSHVVDQAVVITATSGPQTIHSHVVDQALVHTVLTPAITVASHVVDQARVITATSGPQTIHADVVDQQLVDTTVTPAATRASDVVDQQIVVSTVVQATPVDSHVVDQQTVSSIVTPGISRDSHVVDRQIVTTATSGPQTIHADVVDQQLVETTVTPATTRASDVVDQQIVDLIATPATPVLMEVIDEQVVTTTVSPHIYDTSVLATTTVSGASGLTIPDITLPDHALMILSIGFTESVSLGDFTWNGHSAQIGIGDGLRRVQMLMWHDYPAGTGTVSVTWSPSIAQAVAILRLVTKASGSWNVDQTTGADGSSSSAVSVTSSGAIATTPEFVLGATGIESPGGDPAPTWTTPATAGFYVVGTLVAVADGYFTANTLTTQTIASTLASARNWGALIVTAF